MILKPLRRAVSDAPANVVCECRHCGTTVTFGTKRCPNCESTDIVEHDVS